MQEKCEKDQLNPDRSEFTVEQYRREPSIIFDRAAELGRVRVRNKAGNVVVVIDRRPSVADDG